MPTIAELGQRVKTKYPGAYDDMDDAAVGRAVKAKFPGAYDDFSDADGLDPNDAPIRHPVGSVTSQDLRNAALGAGQGATLGFADELQGALAALGGGWTSQDDPDRPVVVRPKGETTRERYISERDEARGVTRAAAEESPVAYRVGEFAGAAVPGVAAVGKKAAGTVLKRALSGAKGGAAFGGAYGAGASEGETPGEVLQDAALGAAGGAVVGGALPIAGAGARAAASRLEAPLMSGASRAAVRSANADRTASRRVFGRPEDEGARVDLGKFLIEEKIPLRSPKAMQEGLEALIEKEGPAIGQLPKQASARGTQADLETVTLKVMDSDVIKTLASDTEGRPVAERVVAFFEDQIKQKGNRVTPEALHKIRMRLDKLARWDKNRPDDVNRAWQAARGVVNDELGAAMESAGLGQEWAASNARFSKAKDALDLASVGAERRANNRFFSPSEKGSLGLGAATAAMADPATALAIPAATYGLNRAFFPLTAKALSSASRRAGRFARSTAPRATAATVSGTVPETSVLAQALMRRFGLLPAMAEEEGTGN